MGVVRYELAEGRECGSCNACCIHLKFDDKPQHIPCIKLSEGRCEAYEERPDFCRSFLCAWIRGALWPAARPDMCGVLVQLVDDKAESFVVNAVECREGALDRNWSVVAACKSLQCRAVRLRYLDGRTVVFRRSA